VRCVAFHPTGSFLLAGTDHPTPRVHALSSGGTGTGNGDDDDIPAPVCYAASAADQPHKGPVRAVAWAPGGEAFATGGADGHVKLWSGHTLALIGTLEKAHSDAAVRAVILMQTESWSRKQAERERESVCVYVCLQLT
jgi:cleavage stimulation factor subunit 1